MKFSNLKCLTLSQARYSIERFEAFLDNCVHMEELKCSKVEIVNGYYFIRGENAQQFFQKLSLLPSLRQVTLCGVKIGDSDIRTVISDTYANRSCIKKLATTGLTIKLE